MKRRKNDQKVAEKSNRYTGICLSGFGARARAGGDGIYSGPAVLFRDRGGKALGAELQGRRGQRRPPAENQPQGLNFPNNAPGLYIAPNTNNLVIFMNTFNVINEEIEVNDIPLNKWVNVMIRCENTTLDVYINGTIVKSHHLHGVPKQNYGDVYIAPNGGFSGYISN
ncbi:MAG: LamG-like jellyroll fold domain-containing protein, partial [Chrysiogenales bacterium]